MKVKVKVKVRVRGKRFFAQRREESALIAKRAPSAGIYLGREV